MSSVFFRDLYWFQPALFTPAQCEALITKARAHKAQTAALLSASSDVSDIRQSDIIWLKDEALQQTLFALVVAANRTAFDCDVTNQADLQFTSYHAHNGGHYDWHADVKWYGDDAYDRKLSVTIQLSDPSDYEGGQFEFEDLTSSTDFTPQGSVLIFPSYARHKVHRVTKGTRHALVAWFTGPRWR